MFAFGALATLLGGAPGKTAVVLGTVCGVSFQAQTKKRTYYNAQCCYTIDDVVSGS
jgi:hypothetical protein